MIPEVFGSPDDRFDFAELVKRQIERCLMAASISEGIFSSAVMALEVLIPEELKDDQFREENEAAYSVITYFESEAPCGMPLGSKQDPCMKNQSQPVKRLEDGSIDWDDPNILSPHQIEEDVINWYYRFEVAFNQFVRIGIVTDIKTQSDTR